MKYPFFSISINNVVGREVFKLLKVPIEHYNNVIQSLSLSAFGRVIRVLDRRGQRQIASMLIQNLIDNETRIVDEESVDKVGIYAFLRDLMLLQL